MQQYYYLILLIFSISGMLIVDRKYKLFFWNSKVAAYKTIISLMLIFIIWDILGILLGIFFHGGSIYTLPIRIVPEFPIEELLFLFLLNYSCINIYLLLGKKWQRT